MQMREGTKENAMDDDDDDMQNTDMNATPICASSLNLLSARQCMLFIPKRSPCKCKTCDQTSYSLPLLSRLCLMASQLSFASPNSIFVPGM